MYDGYPHYMVISSEMYMKEKKRNDFAIDDEKPTQVVQIECHKTFDSNTKVAFFLDDDGDVVTPLFSSTRELKRYRTSHECIVITALMYDKFVMRYGNSVLDWPEKYQPCCHD